MTAHSSRLAPPVIATTFLVVDEVARGLGGDLRVGLVVGDFVVDLAAIDAAGGD